MAANVEIISEHTSFMELIEDRDALVRDLWKRVVTKKPTGEMTMLKLLQKFSFLCESACRISGLLFKDFAILSLNWGFRPVSARFH